MGWLWHKKPVTHALGLWMVVGFAAILLIIFISYTVMLSRIEKVQTQIYPPKTPRVVHQMPSLFGEVVSVEVDGTIFVDSKQSFDTVLVDEVTELSRVGGGAFNYADLATGATIMATGQDRGGGALLADALVILDDAEPELEEDDSQEE